MKTFQIYTLLASATAIAQGKFIHRPANTSLVLTVAQQHHLSSAAPAKLATFARNSPTRPSYASSRLSPERAIEYLLEKACKNYSGEGSCDTFLDKYEFSLASAIFEFHDEQQACIKVSACTSEDLGLEEA
jgi:hypothetical protein